MIKIYVLDIGGADAINLSLSALPESVKETKNEKLQKQRAYARFLLEFAYFECFGGDMPDTVLNNCGRPQFVGSSIDFNISHDENMIALIISDEKRVGIDIQSRDTGVSARVGSLISKIIGTPLFADKYATACNVFCENIGFFYISESGKITPCDAECERRAEAVLTGDDFIEKWTLLESLVKADGTGIGALERTSEILENALVMPLVFVSANGKSFSLCAAAL
ncbi:MAG: hypothetical protein J6Q68_04055 [Clostridia bacterium]|nr:hypothetical protein [Clostridia bacterium]